MYAQRLATFLRVSLTLAQSDIVSIKEEIAFFENYLQLQQMRFEKAINYTINIPDVVLDNGRLPVFSLQLLAENAIKHNVTSVDQPLHISIIANAGKLTVENNLQERNYPADSTNIGLQNLRDRYQLLSEKAPVFEKTSTHYRAILPLL